MAAIGRLSLLALSVACRGLSSAPQPDASSSVHVPVNVHVPESPVSASAPAAPLPPGLAPLEAPQSFAKLAVPGFGEAVVSLPLGATKRRPIALALHGNFDRPEWQCEVWRGITGGDVFVLCPRGIPRRDVPKELDRWEWGSLAKTKAELVAALAALRARYPEHVAEGPVIFTGFSLGAILGASLVRDPELGIGAAVLTEGGYQGWTLPKTKALPPSLRRVLFACGQTECRNAYRYQLEKLFERAELPASMVADVKAGHTYDGSVAELIRAEWPGLVAALEN